MIKLQIINMYISKQAMQFLAYKRADSDALTVVF